MMVFHWVSPWVSKKKWSTGLDDLGPATAIFVNEVAMEEKIIRKRSGIDGTCTVSVYVCVWETELSTTIGRSSSTWDSSRMVSSKNQMIPFHSPSLLIFTHTEHYGMIIPVHVCVGTLHLHQPGDDDTSRTFSAMTLSKYPPGIQHSY